MGVPYTHGCKVHSWVSQTPTPDLLSVTAILSWHKIGFSHLQKLLVSWQWHCHWHTIKSNTGTPMGVSYTHGCTPDSNLAVSRVMGAASVQCRVHIAHQGLLAGQGISIYCQGVVSPWQLAALGLWSLCSTFGSPCPDMLARGFEKIVGWKKSSRISTGMVLMYKGLNFWMNCTRTLENRWDGLVGGEV